MTRPLQNRVTPFGEIVAHKHRGRFMGNRGGRLHDSETKTLLNRRWASKQWITCKTSFKGRRRTVMGAGYTELFFLDEATALAAGHRPCFECRRDAANAFADAWATAKELGARPKAAEIDAVLHQERLDARTKRTWPIDATPPAGAVIAVGDTAYLLVTGAGYKKWRPDGYGPEIKSPRPAHARLLTPPSTVAALRAGYQLEA
ncbi:MAG: hypothetical protein AAGJ73_06560 [Pseudomonadota bacterium]